MRQYVPMADLERLADYTKRRRDALNLTSVDVAGRGGPSDTTLAKIETASANPRAQTLKKLDRALGWKQGSAQVILTGGEPDELESAELISPHHEPGPQRSDQESRRSGLSDNARRARYADLRDADPKDLFDRWYELFVKRLEIEMAYKDNRDVTLKQAHDELEATFYMAAQAKDGRPWLPPWNYATHLEWLVDYVRTEGMRPEDWVVDPDTGETLADAIAPLLDKADPSNKDANETGDDHGATKAQRTAHRIRETTVGAAEPGTGDRGRSDRHAADADVNRAKT